MLQRKFKLTAKNGLSPEKISSIKLQSLKLMIIVMVCVTFVTLIHHPVMYQSRQSLQSPLQYTSSRNLSSVGVSSTWIEKNPDSRYISQLEVNWDQILKVGGKLDNTRDLKIGLLNFQVAEVNHWQKLLPNAEFTDIQLDYIDSKMTWKALYPEWIDEEEEFNVPKCPELPKPIVLEGFSFDLVAVKLPCNGLMHWSRDVARLHLQLAAAEVAANSMGGQFPVHVLFITDCFPVPNLFPCKNLVMREGNAWLYKPDQGQLKEKLKLPIGPCELALSLKVEERQSSESPLREAYATILHSANKYVCGAIAAAQSIRLSGSKRDLVILVDESISDDHRSGLEAAGWKLKVIERIRNPKADPNSYNEWNYSKFRLWQLTEYDKVIFIDADILILRNIDFLFTMPEISAAANNGTIFNSGVMVIEPSNCTFQLLMENINNIVSYNGGDQGYLNEIFTWWHRIPKHMNFLKHFWFGDDEVAKQKKTQLFGADPPILYAIHYLGFKPWFCFRDYDCNWNSPFMKHFASNAAHATWWKLHDLMPENLQNYCNLKTSQKAFLEWDRRQAEKMNLSDRHWSLKITDPRLNICAEKSCNWENMLLHWDDPNFADTKNGTTTVKKVSR